MMSPCPEVPQRIDVIKAALMNSESRHTFDENIQPVNEEIIAAVHSEKYIQFLKDQERLGEDEQRFIHDIPYREHASNDGMKVAYGKHCSDTYTAFSKNIRNIAKKGYEVTHQAGMYAYEHGTMAYALTRPPGHHAMKSIASGTCYLCNA